VRPPLPKLSFDSKKLDDRVLNAVATFRERKFRNKLAGRNNPIVTKQIKFKDTKNRIIKKVRDRVDRSLARSLQVQVVGVGNKKKDIVKPKLYKFRTKKSKNTPVLRLVEKSKHALDTKSEKREIRKQRVRKKSVTKKIKPKITKVKPKVKKTKKVSNINRKSPKRPVKSIKKPIKKPRRKT
ncbi:MAG: hypothetical protein R6U15_07430, partial [Candidatus Izemoplasmatales bacterium]